MYDTEHNTHHATTDNTLCRKTEKVRYPTSSLSIFALEHIFPEPFLSLVNWQCSGIQHFGGGGGGFSDPAYIYSLLHNPKASLMFKTKRALFPHKCYAQLKTCLLYASLVTCCTANSFSSTLNYAFVRSLCQTLNAYMFLQYHLNYMTPNAWNKLKTVFWVCFFFNAHWLELNKNIAPFLRWKC